SRRAPAGGAVGRALGCPSSSRRRNIKQSPQYGPHLLTVRKHGAAIMRASDDAATRNAGRGWRNRLQRLSSIGNRRNPPPRAENAANFFGGRPMHLSSKAR